MLEGVRERLRQTQTVDGYARSSLYKWVKTDTVPSLAALLRFADRQNVSVVWLLTGHGNPKILDVIDIKNFRNRLSSLVYGEEENIHAQTGIEIATLSSWTHPNQRTFPKIDGLLAIAKTTNASVRWLLTGQGPERPFEGEASGEPPCAESAPVTFSPTLPPGALRVIPASPERTRSIPFLGRIEAGFSAIAIQEAETRDFATWMCPRGDAFALRVHGNSMIEVGIHSGDIVILRATPRATDGDVVAATLGEESMLKLLKRSADGWWLVAANKEMTERRPLDGAIIHGVVHTVVRQFEPTSYVVDEPGER